MMAARRALVLLVVMLGGCSLGILRGPAVDEVVLEAGPDANRNSAVAVDVTFALKPSVAELLAGLTAAEWFRRRAQLERDHPDGLKVLSWELVPGQSARADAGGGRYVDGYVYAAYGTPGDHRARLAVESRRVRILLEAHGFVVEDGRTAR